MINNKDGNQTTKRGATAGQHRSQTAEEHGSPSPKITETFSREGDLVRKINGSHAPKRHKKGKDKRQQRQGPCRTPEYLEDMC